MPVTQSAPGTVRSSNSAGGSVFKNVVINGETYQYIEGCGLPPMLSIVGSSSNSAGDAAAINDRDDHEEVQGDGDEDESDTFLDAQEHLDSDLYSDDDGFGDDLPESVLTSTTLWNALPAEDDYLDQMSDFGDDEIDSQTSFANDIEENFDEALLESIADSEYLSDDAMSDVRNKSTTTVCDFDLQLSYDTNDRNYDAHDRSIATISDFDCDDDQSVAELIEAAFADGEFLEDTPVEPTTSSQKDVIVIDGDDNIPAPSSVALGKRKADSAPLHREKAARHSLGEGSQRFPVELDSDEFDEEFDLQAFEEIHENAPQLFNNTSVTEQQAIEIASSSSGSAVASSSSNSQGILVSALLNQQLQRYQQLEEDNLAKQNAAGSQRLSRQRSKNSHGSTPSQSRNLPDEADGMIWGAGSIPSGGAQEPPEDVPSGYTSDNSSQYSDEDPPPPYELDAEEEDPNRPRMAQPDPTKTADGLTLSPDQLYVLDQVVTHNRSVFFTGSAGTGKSVLLRELIVRLRQKYSRWAPPGTYWDSDAAAKVAVTASTGIAACNIGGCTLHSFAGIGLGNEKEEVLILKVRSVRKTVERWRKTCVLIVDEVSMIDAVLLDKLEAIARYVRKSTEPWGGLQIVLTGDFFQLPPVEKYGQARFCFEAASWKSSIHATIQLEQVFRQKDQCKLPLFHSTLPKQPPQRKTKRLHTINCLETNGITNGLNSFCGHAE